MREQLNFIHGMDLLFTLQFHNNSIFYDKVCTKPTVQLHPFIDKWHCFLANNPQPLRGEFVSETAFICGLKKSGTEAAMNLDR